MLPNKTDTSCKNCIFAEYEDITQTGCRVKILDKLRTRNIEILEAYDEEKEFYVIRHRKCMWARPNGWKHTKKTLLMQIESIYKELEIRYQAIIFANNNWGDCKRTVTSLLNQTIPPKHITIIKPTHVNILPSKYIELLENTGVEWRVENIINPATPKGSMIDFVIDVKPHPYYAVFQAGFQVPLSTFEYINNQLVEQLYTLPILTPNKDGNGLVVSWHVHKLHQGHQDVGLVEKLIHSGHILTSITELCPNFPK